MNVQLLSLLLFPLLATSLLTSAYECMFYYYAYLLDSTLSPNFRTLAVGCSPVASVPCTFNQFIGYVRPLPLQNPPTTHNKRPN
jgi:hypothetical protein